MFWFKKKSEKKWPEDEGEQSSARWDESKDAPWFRLNLAFYDVFEHMRIQVKNWQRQSLLSWALSALAVCAMAYLGAQPKIKPYVVEVDKLGRVRAVRALEENDTRHDPERIIAAELQETIVNLRTVTTDREANNRNISSGLSRLDDAAYTYARTELRKAPPNTVGGVKTVMVRTDPPLKISANTWQIEWEETSISLAGEQMGAPERWKAVMQIKLKPNFDDEDEFAKNPYGFKGLQLNWTKL